MPPNEHRLQLLRFGEILFLILTALSFYLLFISRSGEAHTVWQVLNPAFVPAIFVTASLLVMILLTSEKTAYKLLYVVVFSILLHSFFSIVFPAGDLSGQQSILARVRLVFDNTVLHGLTGWPNRNIQVFIYELFAGENLHAALTVIFARMLSIDVFYVHLFFIPILWGTFVPVAVFLVAKSISGNEKAAVLSSLLVSAFPYTIYFGAISVPNSLGFIFFFYSLHFMLRYLSSNESKTAYWMLIFSLFSFLSHYLTGIMSFSLLLLALAFKAYQSEKKSAFTSARISLIISFLASLSLLPLSFICLRVIGTLRPPAFTLDKINQSPTQEIICLLLIGELTHGYNLNIIFLNIAGPLLALLWMLYLLYGLRRKPDDKFRVHIYFLFAAFLIMLIDYRILKLFMENLPINEERLWVLRDFTAAPFVGLAVFAIASPLSFLKKPPTMPPPNLRKLSKNNILRASSLALTLNVLIPALLGGWITFSLSAGYPQVAPLQTTWYELEAVKYIDTNTHEKYVVIGDVWTIYAGEVIVGENNPRAYYFSTSDKTGHDLFVNMTREPSPKWMLLAMNYTDTKVAYFIITEPRIGLEEFENVISRTLQSKQLDVVTVPNVPPEKLRAFSYRED